MRLIAFCGKGILILSSLGVLVSWSLQTPPPHVQTFNSHFPGETLEGFREGLALASEATGIPIALAGEEQGGEIAIVRIRAGRNAFGGKPGHTNVCKNPSDPYVIELYPEHLKGPTWAPGSLTTSDDGIAVITLVATHESLHACRADDGSAPCTPGSQIDICEEMAINNAAYDRLCRTACEACAEFCNLVAHGVTGGPLLQEPVEKLARLCRAMKRITDSFNTPAGAQLACQCANATPPRPPASPPGSGCEDVQLPSGSGVASGPGCTPPSGVAEPEVKKMCDYCTKPTPTNTDGIKCGCNPAPMQGACQ